MGRPAIVTASALERVEKMVRDGIRSAEIANEIGCTLGTLRVRCSQSRISLRHVPFKKAEGDRADDAERREADRTNYHARKTPHRAIPSVARARLRGLTEMSDSGLDLTLPLPQDTLTQLDEWAAVHGTSAASLAAKLLVTIARDSLFAAVLDESVATMGR